MVFGGSALLSRFWAVHGCVFRSRVMPFEVFRSAGTTLFGCAWLCLVMSSRVFARVLCFLGSLRPAVRLGARWGTLFGCARLCLVVLGDAWLCLVVFFRSRVMPNPTLYPNPSRGLRVRLCLVVPGYAMWRFFAHASCFLVVPCSDPYPDPCPDPNPDLFPVPVQNGH